MGPRYLRLTLPVLSLWPRQQARSLLFPAMRLFRAAVHRAQALRILLATEAAPAVSKAVFQPPRQALLPLTSALPAAVLIPITTRLTSSCWLPSRVTHHLPSTTARLV